MRTVDDVKTYLAKHKDLLTFEEVGNYIKVKSVYVSTGKFNEINADIKQIGGERIRGLGKENHWKVPKQEMEKSEQPRPIEKLREQLERAMGLVQGVIDEMGAIKGS